MTVIDKSARIKDEVTFIMNFVKKHCKGVRLVDWEHGVSDGEVYIQVSTNEHKYVKDMFADAARASKHVMKYNVMSGDGLFDWESDTYIKPFAAISFPI